MDLRRFAPLLSAGATYKEIAAEVGCDWRTVRRYLRADAPTTPPPAPPRAGTVARKVDPVATVIDGWLVADPDLRASVIYERLVSDYSFDGHYQRVKVYCAEARLRLAADVPGSQRGLHRRFEVRPGAQAQVDWGDEGAILTSAGIAKLYSFHMTLSYSRDPFCCYTTSQDLGTFFDAHRQAFAHFGGVPAVIVYDRTKTVVKRHVSPGKAVPLHPEAVAFAEHYGFTIDVLAAYRPTGKGRVERQVLIAREHVLAGRTFSSVAEVSAAFDAWAVIRRTRVHRTHGEVIGVRAQRDHAALGPLPERPYVVCDRHLRRVGKDCLISFEGSLYSVPAKAADGRWARAGRRVEVRVAAGELTIHRLAADGPPMLLVRHQRSQRRGAMVIAPGHYDGLPDGHTRAVTADPAPGPGGPGAPPAAQEPAGVKPADLLLGRPAVATQVDRRPLADYDAAGGLTGAELGAGR
ncbi:MAG: IS21 family transposase [Actinomycetes bacterium]